MEKPDQIGKGRVKNIVLILFNRFIFLIFFKKSSPSKFESENGSKGSIT